MGKRAGCILVGIFALAAAAFGQDFRGTYTMSSGTTKLTLVLDRGSGGRVSGTLSSSTGAVFQLTGEIEEDVVLGTCQGQAGTSQFEASFEGSLLIFTLIETGPTGEVSSRSLEFVRAAGGESPSAALGLPQAQPGPAAPKAVGAAPRPAPPQSARPAPASPATDSSLMSYFAGDWYSYSSGSTISGGAGTERTMTLCPDGLYRDSSEFSASGGGWGGATAQAGWGRWSIQGDRIQGVISVTYPNGRTRQFSYRVVSKEEQTINFDGVVYAFAGKPKCR
jgi:hypothetical protein